MLKDKTNQNLLGILVVLAVLYAGSVWMKKGSTGSSALTRNLVHIDTSQITKITIEKPTDHIQLAKEGHDWILTTEEGVQVPAVTERVENMLASLSRLTPSSIVSRDREKWRDYQVDSTGQRIRIAQGENTSLDLVIGRGSMQGQQTFITYVRPWDEDNVYVIENFSGSSVSGNPASYRNKSVLSTTVDSIRQILFHHPDDEDFTLMKENGSWQINGTKADSSRTSDYLKNLRRITSSEFVDENRPALHATPASSLTIQANGADDVLLQLYDTESRQLLHSSQNPENYFADTAAVNKIFLPAKEFVETDQ